MQLDLAGLFGAAEPNPPVAAENRGETAQVADAFASLLAALASMAPAASAGQATGPVAEGESDPGDATDQPPTPAADSGAQAGSSAGVVATKSGAVGMAAVESMELVAPLVLRGVGAPAAPLEVTSEAEGSPLMPSIGGEFSGDGQVRTPLLRLALTGPETPGAPLAPDGKAPGAPDPAAGSSTTPRGLHSATAVDPSVTIANQGLGSDAGDGRPVVILPLGGTAPAGKPIAAQPVPPQVDPVPEDTEADRGAATITAGPDPGDGGPRVAGAPTVEATAQTFTPGPRPTAGAGEAATAATASLGPGTAGSATSPAPALATPSSHTGGAAEIAPSPADPQQVQAQVLRQILGRAAGAAPRPQQITLQLEPEHLGKVEVRLTLHGDQLQVEIQAETAEAGAALREGRHELVRNLTAQAGRWHQVEVRVAERAAPAPATEEHEEERSEHGSRRERDPHQRRRQRDDR